LTSLDLLLKLLLAVLPPKRCTVTVCRLEGLWTEKSIMELFSGRNLETLVNLVASG
jgi:hypothetical protein